MIYLFIYLFFIFLKQALKSSSEEYNAILDVVGRYAVFHAGASITVKRGGETKPDLHTQKGCTRSEALKAVYGTLVAKNLLAVSVDVAGGWGTADERGEEHFLENSSDVDGGLRCSVKGFVTGADYAGRKTQLVLFINDRSVECGALKRCLEASYAALLPKAAKPFAFFDIKLPTRQVDVNVHPTKKEVAFLHQEELIDAIRGAVEMALMASNAQRTFKQALMPGAAPPLPPTELDAAQPTYYRPDKLVRTDGKVQTLHAFLGASQAIVPTALTQPSQTEPEPETLGAHEEIHRIVAEDLATMPSGPQEVPVAVAVAAAEAAPPVHRRRRNQNPGTHADEDAFLPTALEIAGMASGVRVESENAQNMELEEAPLPLEQGAVVVAAQTLHRPVRHRPNPPQSAGLASVERLLASAERAPHAGITDVLRSHTFVGMADATRALLQAGTRLYLTDVSILTRDMFYQQVLRRFGCAPRIAVSPPLSVKALAVVALEAEEVAGRWKV